jgi:hypothetical protein
MTTTTVLQPGRAHRNVKRAVRLWRKHKAAAAVMAAVAVAEVVLWVAWTVVALTLAVAVAAMSRLRACLEGRRR